ncbi:MAG TPA: (2Fe-2S)-binding protein [Ktedonobacteraceae bacterium]|nr:(2Fe-2S)-binding protein [Ktedonobacteraceae bacterium]
MSAHSAAHATIQLKVNGRSYRRSIPVRKLLADVLREDIGLTGTHLGCEHGVCGACTVLIDGRTARSCLVLAVQAEGSEILTVEGLAAPTAPLHPVQEAFCEKHGLQCGFCTPGMLLNAVALLQEKPDPTEEEVREGIAGNICRCTGYQQIIAAVLYAASLRNGGAASRQSEEVTREETHHA